MPGRHSHVTAQVQTHRKNTHMQPRITFFTLGVDDLDRWLRFARDGLGLKTEGIGPRVLTRRGGSGNPAYRGVVSWEDDGIERTSLESSDRTEPVPHYETQT